MTVGEAIFALHKNGVILSNSIKRQIAALLESQASEIERLSKRLEAAEKVCRAAEKFRTDYYIHTPRDREFYGKRLDGELAKWKEAQ